MADCCVLGCRLVLILDDLLWVLTDDQLKAALHFADSLSGLLKRATALTQKVKGARKLEVRNQAAPSRDTSESNQFFRRACLRSKRSRRRRKAGARVSSSRARSARRRGCSRATTSSRRPTTSTRTASIFISATILAEVS